MSEMDGIIGHGTQCSQLLGDISTGNVAHAYLLSGDAHLGKMTVAKRFAETLLVHGVDADRAERILHQCRHLTYADFLVLDMLWIEKVSDDWNVIAKHSNAPQQHRSKKPAAKSDTIGIDDIRALQSRLQEVSLGAYKVCLIRGIERMQDAAANALLKILEEPPKGLVFVLTTCAQSTLLPTIVSRSRVLRFNRLSGAELAPALKGASEEDRRFILGLSQGAPGTALTLVRDSDALRREKQWHAQAHAFWTSSSLRERLKLLKPLEERGEDAQALLLHLAATLRERADAASVRSLSRLTTDLQTNAHRQILLHRFALSLSSDNH